MTEWKDKEGHRARLRQRFLAESAALSERDLLELLLTYAIPRRDVAPLAQLLLDQFCTIENILSAPYDELVDLPGVGEQVAILFKVIVQITSEIPHKSEQVSEFAKQPNLFEMEPDLGPIFDTPKPVEPQVRTFANDEIANSLEFIPQAARFKNLEAFKAHLRDRLPYNSESTRQRRANYISERFFPAERLDVPLTYFADNCTTERDLKPVIFYHVLKAEPLAAKVAEDFIWPALPIGYVDRENMREFILRHLPEASPASQTKILRSIYRTYDLLSVGKEDKTILRFQVHTGTLEAFLYLLTAEFSQPGIFSFEDLGESPLRRWLLWDREWMRRQLYNLRDFGLITKVSEIDTVRQFTLQYEQKTALRHFFEHPERDNLVLREQPLTT